MLGHCALSEETFWVDVNVPPYTESMRCWTKLGNVAGRLNEDIVSVTVKTLFGRFAVGQEDVEIKVETLLYDSVLGEENVRVCMGNMLGLSASGQGAWVKVKTLLSQCPPNEKMLG